MTVFFESPYVRIAVTHMRGKVFWFLTLLYKKLCTYVKRRIYSELITFVFQKCRLRFQNRDIKINAKMQWSP